MQTTRVVEWLAKFTSEEIIELPGKPVVDQLKFYDEYGTGIGFIMYLVPMIEDTAGGDDNAEKNSNPVIEYHLKTRPVVRMRNDWYTVEDDNLEDILSAVIRMLN